MAKEGFSHAAIEGLKYVIKKPRTEVREEKMRGDEFPGHKQVKAAIQRHPAMLRQIQTLGFLPCQNGTAMNPQTLWTCKGTGAPPPFQCSELIPEPTAPPAGTPPAPTGITSGAQPAEIIHSPAGHPFSHTALHWAEYFEDDEDTEHDTDFDPDMLTDEG